MTNEKRYNTNQFAKLLWIYPSTLDNWDKTGKYVAKRDPIGRKYYTEADFIEIQKRVKNGSFKVTKKSNK